jgi:hypothetical protein
LEKVGGGRRELYGDQYLCCERYSDKRLRTRHGRGMEQVMMMIVSDIGAGNG